MCSEIDREDGWRGRVGGGVEGSKYLLQTRTGPTAKSPNKVVQPSPHTVPTAFSPTHTRLFPTHASYMPVSEEEKIGI